MNIILIGYRGSGKSTVARLVAERLGWDWVDADAILEEKAGRSIRQIFEVEGEAGFRDRETATIRELAIRDRIVIAAGGGAVLREENRQIILQSAHRVWLVASPEAIERRITADPTTASRRPPLTTAGGIDEIRRLLCEREPLYRACASLIIETDQSTPAQVAGWILESVSVASPSSRME